MTSRQPYLCTKNIYILWELNSFHMLDFFLFQAICKATDHVTKNDLYPGKIMNHDQFESMTDLWRTFVPCCNSWDIKKKLWRSLRLFLNLFLYFLPIFGGGFKLITITQISHRTTYMFNALLFYRLQICLTEFFKYRKLPVIIKSPVTGPSTCKQQKKHASFPRI